MAAKLCTLPLMIGQTVCIQDSAATLLTFTKSCAASGTEAFASDRSVWSSSIAACICRAWIRLSGARSMVS